MSDKELLELAAKAAGIEYEFIRPELGGCLAKNLHGWRVCWWNPLTDDGDALRLAVKMGLGVEHYVENNLIGVWFQPSSDPGITAYELTNDDPYVATRRAIVRAAAEIGKVMNE